MRNKRILIYLLAAGLLGLLVYTLVPSSDPARRTGKGAEGDTDGPRPARRHGAGGAASLRGFSTRSADQKVTTIEGRTRDGDTGKPVAEVQVQLRSAHDSASAVSAADGTFRLEVGEQGRYEVRLRCATHVPAGLTPTLQVVQDSPIKGLDLALYRLATVDGRVADGRLSPTASATVRVARARGQRRFSLARAVTTDARGRFTLKVPPGEVVLRAEAGQLGAALSSPLYIKPGAHLSGVTLLLGGGFSLTGKVVGPGGRRVTGAEVALQDAMGTRTLPCDAEGAFAVGGLLEGSKLLQARAEGFSPSHVSRITIQGDRPQHVVLVVGLSKGVGGQVVDQEGNPVAGIKVTARPGSQQGKLTHLLTPLEETTSPAGQFMFKEVPNTPLVLTARASGGQATASRAGVPPGTYDVVLKLQRTGGIVGQVTSGTSGRAVQDYTISISGSSGTGDPYGVPPPVRVVSADGKFTLDGLLPGTYSLAISAGGYGAETRAGIAVSADLHSQISVVLNDSGAVGGVVVDGRGVGLPGVAVKLETGWQGRAGVTDAQGRFRIDDVSRGRRTLVASHPGYDTRLVSGVSVFPGSTTEVRVELSLRRGKTAGLKLSGIGAVLSEQGGKLTVVKTLPGSPAEAAGILGGDRVVAIDGKDYTSFPEAIEAIRGVVGTPVRLKLNRAEAVITVDVIRDDVMVPGAPS